MQDGPLNFPLLKGKSYEVFTRNFDIKQKYHLNDFGEYKIDSSSEIIISNYVKPKFLTMDPDSLMRNSTRKFGQDLSDHSDRGWSEPEDDIIKVTKVFSSTSEKEFNQDIFIGQKILIWYRIYIKYHRVR